MRISSLLASSALLLAASVYGFSEETMLCLVNEERGRYGLRNLGIDDRLNYAAAEHSEYQARKNKMTHNGSGGSSPADRVDEAGYRWQSVAENVAYGYQDEEECMTNWMNSPGHRKNILGSSYTHFGCGVAYSRSNVPYYTQDFGSDGSGGRYPECDGGYSGGRGRGRSSNYDDEEEEEQDSGDWYDQDDSGDWGNDDSGDWYDGDDWGNDDSGDWWF
jgi:hypothetical protein